MTGHLGGAAADTLQPILGTTSVALGSALLRAGGALLLILLLIVGLAALYRRWLGRHGRTSGAVAIRVLNSVPLGRRNSLVLVEVGARRVLVGATPTQLTSLSEWEEAEETVAEAVAEARLERAARFEPVLSRVLTKLRALEGNAS